MRQPEEQLTLNARLNATLHKPDGTRTKPKKLPAQHAQYIRH